MKSLIIAIVMIMIIGVPAFGEEYTFFFTPEEIDGHIIIQESQSNEWGNTDTTLQYAFSVSLLADYITTIDGLNRGATEQNPIIGENPSFETVTIYAGTCMYLNYLIASKIKSKFWRFVWQFASLSFEVYCVDGNLKISK